MWKINMTFLTTGIISVCHLCSTGKEFTRIIYPEISVEGKGKCLQTDQEEMMKSQSRTIDHWEYAYKR